MGFTTIKDFLAVVGGVAMIIAPFAIAWLTILAQKAVRTAPAYIELKGKVDQLRQWQDDHAEDVKLVPKLAAILERVEATLERLCQRLDQ